MHAHRSPAVVEVAAVKGEDRLQTRACGYTAQSRWRDLNPQPADYETAALPLSYGGRMGVAAHAFSSKRAQTRRFSRCKTHPEGGFLRRSTRS